MPRKIRQLIADLRAAGFRLDRQKDSPPVQTSGFPRVVPLSGAGGNDAKNYQERQVAKAIETTRRKDQCPVMKPEDRYHRFVRWSDDDQCYIGYCPDLYEGGVCHGEREEATYTELCGIVRDEIVHRQSKGEPLPEPAVRATRDLDLAAAG